MEVLNNFFVGVLETSNHTDSTNESKQLYYNDILESENINGKGKLFITNENLSLVYNGPIVNSKMNGNGYIIYTLNKENPLYKSYQGELQNNYYNGEGIITFTNGDVFIGNFSKGKKDGPGKMYNSNGDLTMDNIWKNDIICGKVDYIDYYHNTKIPKIIGQLSNSIKIGHWLNIREDETIERIDYYNISESETGSGSGSGTRSESKSNEIIKQLITHNNGYPKVQCLHYDNKPSIEELCMGTFKYFDDKLIYKTKRSNKNNSSSGSSNLDKGINNNDIDYANMSKYATMLDTSKIKDHTMYLYLDSKGKKVKITEFINNKEYDYIVYLDDGSNKNVKYFVNNFNINPISKQVTCKSSIYQIDSHSDIKLPMLYYEGETNNSYLPHGTGIIYSNGNIKMSGIFDKGHITNGILCAEHDSKTYLYYDGSFKNDNPDGEGSFYDHNNNKLYDGQVSNGKRHGDGISYWLNGVNNWKGRWHHDKKHGKGTLYADNGELICHCTHNNDQFEEFDNI